MENKPTAIELAKQLLKEEADACRGMAPNEERLRQCLRLHKPEYIVAEALLDTHAELEEEQRINGASGERELALLARAERAEKRIEILEREDDCTEQEQFDLQEEYEKLLKEALDKDARIAELQEILRATMCLDVRGHTLADRLQFSDIGRRILEKVSAALAPRSADGKGE